MISIIIPSFKRPDVLTAALLDLRHQNFFKQKEAEILIGLEKNDPRLDRYQFFLKQVQSIYANIFGHSVLISACINNFQGLVKAKIACVNKAQHPLLFFMDDDLFFEPNYLVSLVRDLQEDSSSAAVSGFIVTYEPAISHTQPSDQLSTIPTKKKLQTLNIKSEQQEWRLVFGSKEQVMDWSQINQELPATQRYEMDYFVNSFLCHKSDYLRVGGFNAELNSLTSAHEEVDLTYRLQRDGRRLIFNPFVQGWHLTVKRGGIYKGEDFNESKKVLEREYHDLLPILLSSIKK